MRAAIDGAIRINECEDCVCGSSTKFVPIFNGGEQHSIKKNNIQFIFI